MKISPTIDCLTVTVPLLVHDGLLFQYVCVYFCLFLLIKLTPQELAHFGQGVVINQSDHLFFHVVCYNMA